MPRQVKKTDYLQTAANIHAVRLITEAAIRFHASARIAAIVAYYAQKQLEFGSVFAPELIDEFLAQNAETPLEPSAADEFAGLSLDFSADEDVLGFLYMSLQPHAKRKKSGAYYTKSDLARSMIQTLDLGGKTLMDPCCGTGVFLIEALKNGGCCKNIFGCDIDPIAVFIARINMLARCGRDSYAQITRNIICADSLFDFTKTAFDLIVGNPPWGSRFTEKTIKLLRKNFCLAPKRGNPESFKLFIERSIQLLKSGGILSFVLPESLLTVKTHQDVRKLLLSSGSVSSVTYLENTFRGVFCPSITLTFLKNGASPEVLVKTPEQTYRVKTPMNEKMFSYHITDKSERIINAVYNNRECISLKNNARFALGIVTGNNKKYILRKPEQHCEPIYKGKDIEPFSYREPSHFIVFNPQHYQQTAPAELFRQPKIAYRFVSNSLICTYDERGSLLLNSANFFVPGSFFSPEALVCLLNSSLYTFLYRNLFCAAKVLRSHLESLPLPVLTACEVRHFKNLYHEMKKKFDPKILNANINSIFFLD